MIINEVVSKVIEIDLGHYKVVRYRDSTGKARITLSVEYGALHEINFGNGPAGFCNDDAYEMDARNFADALNAICDNPCDYNRVPKEKDES